MKQSRTATLIAYAILTLWLLLSVFPVFWSFLTSIKQTVDALSTPPVWTFTPDFSGYLTLWDPDQENFGKYLYNTLFVAFFTVLISVTIGALAGYALARYTSVGGFYLLMVALLFRALPRMALVMPYYYFGQTVGIYDTKLLLILVLVTINQPFTIWMFRGFFKDVPESVDEAAMVDGCSRVGAFWHAILPLALPGAITASIFTLLLTYNEFLMPVVLTPHAAQTLPAAIASFGADDPSKWTTAAAGGISITLPIVLIVLALQKFFVRGLTSGAVKG